MTAKEFNENELLFDELYEKTKDCGRVQFINLLMEKERENNELKKKLDELQTLYNNMFKCHCNRVQVETLLSQQKEFIEWLEDYIDALKQQKETIEGLDIGEEHILMILEEVLEKYKGIIGGSNENNSI